MYPSNTCEQWSELADSIHCKYSLINLLQSTRQFILDSFTIGIGWIGWTVWGWVEEELEPPIPPITLWAIDEPAPKPNPLIIEPKKEPDCCWGCDWTGCDLFSSWLVGLEPDVELDTVGLGGGI